MTALLYLREYVRLGCEGLRVWLGSEGEFDCIRLSVCSFPPV